LNSNADTTNPNLYVVLEGLKRDYAFNMETLKEVQYQDKKHPQKNLFRNRRIINLMDRHAKSLLTLNDYFIKISKTIGKKDSFDLDVNNNESSS
jgi:hypothetical protein